MTAAPLSYPADLWCPSCQEHIRASPDAHAVNATIPPLCPVCTDDPTNVRARTMRNLMKVAKMDARHAASRAAIAL